MKQQFLTKFVKPRCRAIVQNLFRHMSADHASHPANQQTLTTSRGQITSGSPGQQVFPMSPRGKHLPLQGDSEQAARHLKISVALGK